MVMSAMDSLVKYYSKNNLVSFASVTVDPERDDKTALKDYMKEFKQRTSKWSFLTGDTST
jgi:protein SCO1/2